MGKKDVFIAILATFCLTTILFVVLPTKSSPSAGEYDSWADINEDGVINMYDIAYSAQRFNTAGDSAKNVNVTNWPSSKLQYETMFLGEFNITSGKMWYFHIPDVGDQVFCGGCSKLGVLYQPIVYSDVGNFTVYLSGIEWHSEAYSHNVAYTVWSLERVHLSNSTIFVDGENLGNYVPEPALVDVKAPYFILVFSTETDSPDWMNMWVVIDVWVYLRND